MNPLTVSPERLQRLRQICLTLPEATEKVAWGDPTWRIRDKIFAMQKGNVEGGRPSLWLKAPDGAQSALVEGDPKRFFVPPYVGHKGWVGIYLDTRGVEWAMVESLVEESYRRIAPKRLAAASAEGLARPAKVGKAKPRKKKPSKKKR
jgi:predicted DNA-binding protein (MmcQ/YjbR family)